MRIPVDALLLAAAVVATAALAVVWPHPVTTLLATVLLILAQVRLMALAPTTGVLLVPFVWLHVALMASMMAIESGAWMKEMGATGHHSPAGALFVIYSMILMGSTALTASAVQRNSLPRAPVLDTPGKNQLSLLTLFIGAAAVAYLACRGLMTGFPLLTGTDRFVYRSATDAVTLNLLNMKAVFGCMLGVGAVASPTRLRAVGFQLVFALYILVSFLFGDKFFIIFNAASFFLMPYLLAAPQRMKQRLFAIAPALGVIVIAIAGVTVFIYSEYGALSPERTLSKLGERMVGQGQLWFLAVEDNPSWLKFDATAAAENLDSLTANPAATYVFEHRLAPFYFVEKYSPGAMYVSFIHNKGSVTPTMAFEAYGLVLFGYVGLALLVAFMGGVIGLLGHWLMRQMATGVPLRAILPAFVLAQTVGFMAQGTMYSLIGLSTFKQYLAFLVLQQLAAWWTRGRPRGATEARRAPFSNRPAARHCHRKARRPSMRHDDGSR